jgi:hypothetical protein
MYGAITENRDLASLLSYHEPGTINFNINMRSSFKSLILVIEKPSCQSPLLKVERLIP